MLPPEACFQTSCIPRIHYQCYLIQDFYHCHYLFFSNPRLIVLPRHFFPLLLVRSLVWLWRGVHTEVGPYLGCAQNGVTGLGYGIELVSLRGIIKGEADLVSTSPTFS